MFFASGRTKTTLVVAVNGPKNQKTEESTADFYKVEAWGKLADLATNYLQKGNQVTVCGRLTFDHWTDKQGRRRVTPVVEANQLALPPRPRLEIVSGADASPGTLSGEVDISDPGANPLASGAFLSDEDFAQITKETNTEINTKPTAALDKSGQRRKTAQTA
jgi:single-strand DNA-binding protein